jgi:hypothetical protein
MFFAVFGGLLLIIGTLLIRHMQVLLGFIIAGAAGLVMLSMGLAGQARVPAEGAIPTEEKNRQERTFRIVVGVQWAAIILAAQFLPRYGHLDLVMPASALIVGLHFFFLPPLHRWRSNQAAGVLLMLLAVLCPLVFKGLNMVVITSLASGIVLWVSAAWALRTASVLLRHLNTPSEAMQHQL